MGKKYLLEIEENKDGSFAWSNFAPYTAPDLEQVRKEGYDKGYDDAKGGYENGFENGMIVAWDAARKICTNWVLPDSVLSEIFGMDKTIDDIMIENTASEAIATIRAYEQKKEEQDGLRQNIQTIVDQCGYTIDEITEVLQKMKEA